MKTTYFLLFLLLTSVDLQPAEVTRRERFLDFLFKSKSLKRPDWTKPMNTLFIKAQRPESPIGHIKKGIFLTFNITSIPRDEFVIRSDLSIFQTSLRNAYEQDSGMYTITILEKVWSWFNPEKLRFLGFQVVTPNYNGWRNFNITKATKEWLRRNQTQLNIAIIVQNSSGDCLTPDLFGIYGVETDSHEYIPFISVFSL